jgi:hypothetical protein
MSANAPALLIRKDYSHIRLTGLVGTPLITDFLQLKMQKKLKMGMIDVLKTKRDKDNLQHQLTDEAIAFESDLVAAIWRAAARFRLIVDNTRFRSLKALCAPENVQESLDCHWADLLDTVSMPSAPSACDLIPRIVGYRRIRNASTPCHCSFI